MSYILSGDSGSVVFDKIGTVTDESSAYNNRVTSNPIEGGSPINDHAINDAVKFDVSGFTVTDGADETLKAMWKNRDLLAYRGVESFDNLIITGLSVQRNEEAGRGFIFKASFQMMNLADSIMVPIMGASMSDSDKNAKTTAKTKKKTEQGLQPLSSDYSSYTSSFDSKSVNADVALARTNPSYPGY